MLTAWHDLGQKMVRGHLHVAMNGAKRSQAKPMPNGWLGRQRRIVSLMINLDDRRILMSSSKRMLGMLELN